MSNIIEISSTANSQIKRIARLIKHNKERQEEGIVIIDGKRDIEEAMKAAYTIDEFYYCSDLDKQKNNDLNNFINNSKNNYFLSKTAFEKISYKKNPDGFLAVVRPVYNSLENIKLKKDALIVVLESVEKPGNLGGIIRTAYAAGVDLIILNDQKTDIFSPNVIRSSTGFIFALPIVLESVDNSYNFLEKNNFKIFTTSLKASKSHFDADFLDRCAFVFGTESWGLSELWESRQSQKLKIPMSRDMDSLNVSVSVAVLLYESLRQRKYNKI